MMAVAVVGASGEQVLLSLVALVLLLWMRALAPELSTGREHRSGRPVSGPPRSFLLPHSPSTGPSPL